MMLAIVFFVGAFIRVKKFHSIPNLLWIFTMKGFRIWLNVFSASIEMVTWLFLFS